MKILRKSKEKIQCSLYPIQMLLELFSFGSLPSLCCNMELSCVSLSSAGHLAVCPHLLLLGVAVSPMLPGCGCWHWGHPAEQELPAQELCSVHGLSLDAAALPGLCRNRTPSVCWLGQRTCYSEMSIFVLQDFLGLYVPCW